MLERTFRLGFTVSPGQPSNGHDDAYDCISLALERPVSQSESTRKRAAEHMVKHADKFKKLADAGATTVDSFAKIMKTGSRTATNLDFAAIAGQTNLEVVVVRSCRQPQQFSPTDYGADEAVPGQRLVFAVRPQNNKLLHLVRHEIPLLPKDSINRIARLTSFYLSSGCVEAELHDGSKGLLPLYEVRTLPGWYWTENIFGKGLPRVDFKVTKLQQTYLGAPGEIRPTK